MIKTTSTSGVQEVVTSSTQSIGSTSPTVQTTKMTPFFTPSSTVQSTKMTPDNFPVDATMQSTKITPNFHPSSAFPTSSDENSNFGPFGSNEENPWTTLSQVNIYFDNPTLP